MKSKCYTFTVSKGILTTLNNTNISQYVKDVIKYFFNSKCYKLIFSPEAELLFKSAQHCQISVRLSDNDFKKIKSISKRYNKSRSATIDNMLQPFNALIDNKLVS